MKKLILTAAALFSMASFADIPAIPAQGPEADVANFASSIFDVHNFKSGKTAYKVVVLDSALNGDIQATTILYVGEGAVGGAAGYEAAFLITPSSNPEILALRKVKMVKDVLVFTVVDGNGKPLVKKYRYDAASNTLKDVK